jgi:hypothetical protein
VNASFVFGFDHDDFGTFEKTAAWIERYRLACATFHILTPYPGTPLFRRLEREGRILTLDWSRYDTSHAVFIPRLMSAEELEEGYAWCYRTLFSVGSIWRRRPRELASLPAYLGGSLLYKKMNWLWPRLTQARATHAVWRPLIILARRRHQARVGKVRSEEGGEIGCQHVLARPHWLNLGWRWMALDGPRSECKYTNGDTRRTPVLRPTARPRGPSPSYWSLL